VIVGPLGPVPPLVDLAAAALGRDAVLGAEVVGEQPVLARVGAEQGEAPRSPIAVERRAWMKLFQKFVS
jgi:hypothetical protein